MTTIINELDKDALFRRIIDDAISEVE